VNLNRYVGNGATLLVDPSGMAWGWGTAVAGGAVGGAVSGVICVGSSLLFDGELPTQGKVAGAVTSGIVSGGIVAGCASGDPTFIGAVAIGAAAGGLGAAAGSVLEQGIDHGKVDPGKVIHDGVIGAAGGLIGAGLGKAIGGSVGNGSLRVPTGMAPAVNLNGTLTYVLTHTDIQQKALVMAGVMAAATQLTAQAARGLAMAVQGGSNGDPATEMPAKEADNVVASNSNPHLVGRTPLAGTRGTGVQRAARQEVDLVRRTGAGTVDWTAEEIAFIQEHGRLPRGTVGHHINNVAEFPDWSGDPRNIRFVRGQAGNLVEHNGSFQNHTTGQLIDREELLADFLRRIGGG